MQETESNLSGLKWKRENHTYIGVPYGTQEGNTVSLGEDWKQTGQWVCAPQLDPRVEGTVTHVDRWEKLRHKELVAGGA